MRGWPLMLLALLACKDDPSEVGTEPTEPGEAETEGTDETPKPAAMVEVTLRATYDRPAVTAWDGLDYDDLSVLPIRGAAWWARANNELIAEGITGETGLATFEVPAGVSVEVGIAALSPTYDLQVVDNTADDALWTLLTTFGVPQGDTVNWEAHAPLRHNGEEYTTRASAPFAIFDTMLQVTRRVDELVDEPFPPLTVHWSPHNRPTSGDIELGRIGTTKHIRDRGIFVLGAEDIDTDEYDITVLAHEWFHYFEHAFSRSESEGGSHGRSSILQLSTAWSEGSVTALGNHILDVQGYRDSTDVGQADSWENDLERNRIGEAIGWYGERSVSSILWDLTDAAADEGDNLQVPSRELFDVLTGSLRDTPALTSIFSFGHALVTDHPEKVAAIDALWMREDVVAPRDPWGTGETNDGGDPGSLPLFRGLEPDVTLDMELGPASVEGNRVTDYRYFRFRSNAETTWQVDLVGEEDVDLFIRYRGEVLCSSRSLGGVEQCDFDATDGADYVIEIDGSYLDEVRTPVSLTLTEVPR